MATFDFDQEYAANFSYQVTREFPVRMIGQEISIPGLFLGPIYFYYLVPFFMISHLHPVGGVIGSLLVGLVIIVAYFFVAKELFGGKAGLIAAFLRAILFQELTNDYLMAPSYASELLALLTIWGLNRLYRGQTKALLLIALLFGLYTSIHPILMPFYLVLLVMVVLKRQLLHLQTTIFACGLFLLSNLPLILFEYFHRFLEVKKLLSLFTGVHETKNLSTLLYYLQLNLLEPRRILSLELLPKPLFILALLWGLAWLYIKRVGPLRTAFHRLFLPLTYSVFIAYYFFFPSHVSEYYFLGLTTLAVLYLSAFLSRLTKKRVGILLLSLILINISFFQLKALWARWNNPSLVTLYHKDKIVKEIITRQRGQPFSVTFIDQPGWSFGFNYLFKLYGFQDLSQQKNRPNYTIVIPKFLSLDSINISSGNIGIILPK